MTLRADTHLVAALHPSPNIEPRSDGRHPDMLLLHYTGMPSCERAIDWLSRGKTPVVFRDRPVGLIGTSPGRFGTAKGQVAWLTVFNAVSAQLYTGGNLQLSGANALFDDAGELTDEATRGRVEKYMAGFSAFVARCNT